MRDMLVHCSGVRSPTIYTVPTGCMSRNAMLVPTITNTMVAVAPIKAPRVDRRRCTARKLIMVGYPP